MARKMGSLESLILVLLFFALGTSNTIVTKVIFTLKGEGSNGEWKPFHKPAFGNWNMFFGMFLVIFIHFYFQRTQPQITPDSQPFLDNGEKKDPMSFKQQVAYIAIPAVFDIFGTGLSLVGIIIIPASVWQMLRGAEIVFAALLTVTVLRRQLHCFHWVGVLFALLGIICVSAATIMGGSVSSEDSGGGKSTSLVAFGVGVTLVSQVVQAAQIIAEEKLLVDLEMTPLLVVGVEGIWGLLIMTFIVYPLLWFCPGQDNNHLEDPVDTISMIQSSGPIVTFVILDFLSCAVYNVLGQKITQDMSGMMRVMLEATRTMCVWVFNLTWFYCVNPESLFGERWTNWSYLEGLGFVLLIIGQSTYGELLKLPGFYYPPPTPAGSPGRFASPVRLKGANLASPVNVISG